jgi:hypothetical protein
VNKQHYHAATQRTFRQAVIHLLESEYKLVGSRRVIQMIADDIVELHKEYFRKADQVPPGHIVWRGTLDEGRKPPPGRRAGEEPTVTAVLPLITAEDIAEIAQDCPPDTHRRSWERKRNTRRVARLVKDARNNPSGPMLLAIADLSLLLNRSVDTVHTYIQDHFEQTGELLPTKGYVLDMGCRPTHKDIILRLYEQGIAPPNIARRTDHSLTAVDRYIKDYERVKVLLSKGLTVEEISQAIGRGVQTVLQYREIVSEFHSDLVATAQEEG